MVPFAAATLALIVALYAVAALFLGWGLQISGLVRHSLTQTAMVPATALSFVFAGLSMITALSGRVKLSHLLNALLLGLVGLTMMGQVSGWHGPSALFFAQTEATERMAMITALVLVLYVWAANRILKRSFFAVECIGVLGISAALAITLMNLTGTTDLPGLSYTAGISLQTSVLAGLLFLALSIVAFGDEQETREP
ncbi:MAG: hypothetical protein HKN30_03425 [Sulfitobacter sp.]|nr:hypothetical protein [Sulfitobacter sp.]